MHSVAFHTGSLEELEARQDDLLRQLDELERRIAAVVADYSGHAQTVESHERTEPEFASRAA
jgi:hypothetical protein